MKCNCQRLKKEFTTKNTKNTKEFFYKKILNTKNRILLQFSAITIFRAFNFICACNFQNFKIFYKNFYVLFCDLWVPL